jgi:uncharacterized membrane protein YvbJ
MDQQNTISQWEETNMWDCLNCGSSNKEDTDRCTICGHKLVEDSEVSYEFSASTSNSLSRGY